MYEQIFNKTIDLFQKFEEVDAIILGGSRASGKYDSTSDYDVYVYLNNALSIEKRKSALSQTCNYMGLGKTCWGADWDECILNNGIPIEVTYENINVTRQSLSNTLEKHIAWDGYTTCVCYVVFNSKVLYDPKGLYSDMVKRFTKPYPEQLRKNIVSANKELLNGITPSYLNQIEKAIKRNDVVSINHRLAAFTKSYFDILFALNRKFHPGEKRLIEFGTELCEWLPVDFETDLHSLFASNGNDKTVPIIRKLISNLDNLIDKYL